MFLNDTFPISSGPKFSTIPVENYPVLLVKGEIDPGIIHGTVRYGGWNTTLYGKPIQVAGRVRAVGIADDPNTGESTKRSVEARGYFNASAQGHFEIEGVAPGTYDVYASAAGFPEQRIASSINIRRGKSLEINCYLDSGPVVSGVVFSKHSFGSEPWTGTRPITIEIYDDNTYQNIGDLQWELEHLKCFSPINLTHSPFTSYVIGDTIWTGNKFEIPPVPKMVAFPWEGPTPAKDLLGIYNGVGPAQYWWVDPDGTFTNGGGSSSFIFRFGVKGVYGVPSEFDGRVPQVYATWINGLSVGSYYLRAWVNGYVQSDVAGTATVDCKFSISGVNWAGDIYVPMDLFKSSSINQTVHFHDLQGTLLPEPVRGPDRGRYVIVEAFNDVHDIVAFNFTWISRLQSSVNVTLNGFGMAGPIPSRDAIDFAAESVGGYGGDLGMKYFLYRYRHIRDYGIMPGTYQIRVYVRGYLQKDVESASVTLCGGIASLSCHMDRGASINLTIYSLDYQHPKLQRDWVWAGSNYYAPTDPGPEITVRTNDQLDYTVFYNLRYWNGRHWATPIQTVGQTSIPYPGWKLLVRDPTAPPSEEVSYLVLNGTTILEERGPDFSLVKSFYRDFGDMKCMGYLPFRAGWSVFGNLPFLWTYTGYRDTALESVLALKSGMYKLRGDTLGYVQEDRGNLDFISVASGKQSDVRLDLLIGVNVSLTIMFKKERLFDVVPYNMSMRIRILDENGELVSAVTSTQDYAIGGIGPGYRISEFGTSLMGTGGYIPAGVSQVVWLMGGFRDYEPMPGIERIIKPEGSKYRGDRGGYDYGIPGSPLYGGAWTIEIETSNWHLPHLYYPPPPGLLLGESPEYFAYNHLGPFEQRTTVVVPNVRLYSEASVVLELDLRGYVQGNVYGFTWCDEIRPTSWSAITVTGENQRQTVYSYDGRYEFYASPGSYTLEAVEWTQGNEGHSSQQIQLTVSDGSFTTGIDFYLNRTEIPIAEFPGKEMTSGILCLGLACLCPFIYRRHKR